MADHTTPQEQRPYDVEVELSKSYRLRIHTATDERDARRQALDAAHHAAGHKGYSDVPTDSYTVLDGPTTGFQTWLDRRPVTS